MDSLKAEAIGSLLFSGESIPRSTLDVPCLDGNFLDHRADAVLDPNTTWIHVDTMQWAYPLLAGD